MTAQLKERGRRLLHALERAVGQRDPVVGCLTVALIALGMSVVLLVMQGLALALPAAGRYYRPGMLVKAELLTLGASAFYAAVAAYCWCRAPAAATRSWLPAGLCGVMLAACSGIAILYGLEDMPMSLMLLSAVALARTWFPARVVLPGTVVALLLVVASELLQRYGLLDYAPLLARPVMDGRPPAAWWLNWSEAIFNLVAIFFAALMFFIFWLMGRYNDRLETMARVDCLTGLANRATFMRRLDAYCRRRTAPEPACLLLCDLDRFRRLNEAHGQAAGDEVLQRTAAWLQQAARPGLDVVARFGGGSFAVLMPGRHLPEARRLARQLEAFLASRPFGLLEQSQVTVSIGIAEDCAGDSATFLGAAGGNLHYAKALGGDRMEVSAAAAPWRPGTRS